MKQQNKIDYDKLIDMLHTIMADKANNRSNNWLAFNKQTQRLEAEIAAVEAEIAALETKAKAKEIA